MSENGLGDVTGILSSLIAGVFVFTISFFPWLFLRKYLKKLYFPRELENDQQYKPFSWILPTWLRSTTILIRRCGIKSVLYLKWKISMMALFFFMLGLASLFLLPIYIWQAPTTVSWFEKTTATALPENSPYSWVTFIYTILVGVAFLIMMFLHRHGYRQSKIQHERLGGNYLKTILIKNLPKSLKDPMDIHLAIEKISKRKVETVSIVWKPAKGTNIFQNQKKLAKIYLTLTAYRKLFEKREKPIKFRPPFGFIPGYLLCRKKVDAIQYYQKEFEALRVKNEEERNRTLEEKKHFGIAYVVFGSMRDCEYVKGQWPFSKEIEAIGKEIPWDIKKWKITDAKPHRDIIWQNVGSSALQRNIKKTISTFLVFLFALFWTIPIAILTNLDNLSKIPALGPYIDNFFDDFPILYETASGLLPSIVTIALFHFFPQICLKISSFERHHHLSALDTSAMEKFWIFVLFNFFIFYMVFSSGVDMVQSLIQDPKEFSAAFSNLDWGYYGIFYCNYFITMCFFDGVVSFLRPYKLLRKYFMKLLAIRGSPIQKHIIFQPSRFKYFKRFAKEAVYFGIVTTFAPIAPLVVVFALMAYGMSYFSDKTLVGLCYSHDYGLGGKIVLRFVLFVNISLLLSYILWLLFFLSHGPEKILFVAIPAYLALWLCTLGSVLWIVYLSKLPTRQDSELWSFLENSKDGNNSSPTESYSWEFITSVEAITREEADKFLLAAE